MKQSNKGRVLAMIVITLAFFALMIGFVFSPKNTKESKLKANVIIENGEASYHAYRGQLNISRAGEYDIRIDWMPDESCGFLSGFVLYDLDGSVITFCTGQIVDAGFLPMKLEKDIYEFEFKIFTSEDELNAFLKDCGDDYTSDGGIFEGYKDGQWEVEYTVRATLAAKYMLFIFLVGCAAYGIIMALLILRMCHEGKPEYDERQKLVNGKAYEYGFYTMLVLGVTYSFAWFCGLADEFITPGAAVELILLVVCAVVGIYNVFNDGYLAVNAYEGRVIAALTGIFFLNVLAVVLAVKGGTLITDGKAGYSFSNVFCGVFILALIIAICIKKARRNREDDDEELEA